MPAEHFIGVHLKRRYIYNFRIFQARHDFTIMQSPAPHHTRNPMHLISLCFRIVFLVVFLPICLVQQAAADPANPRQPLRLFFSNNVLGELEPCG